jgi:uncharacterized membrane protein YeiH
LSFISILELLGTLSFAISGIRIASTKQIDWFGAYIIGLVTSIGGGTIRDLLLNTTPFWMLDPKYFFTSGFALLATLLFKNKIFQLGSTLFLFDSIGLGLFTIVGIKKSIDAEFPFWVCIIMGTITGSLGGVIRDVLLNEIPLLLRKDIYALACVIGGSVYFGLDYLDLPYQLKELISVLTIIFIRVLAVRYQIHLPKLESLNKQSKDQ